MMQPFDIQLYLREQKERVDKALDKLLPAEKEFPPQIHQAMRYCLFAGGKRLRPILALAAAEAVGGNPESIISQVCALELIHTYTLIHDDLPAMDNDDYRRGRLSTHKVFGEAVAILAGDALLTEAFRVLAGNFSNDNHSPKKIIEIIRMLADASGSKGIIGGQVVDLDSEGKVIEKNLLDYMHTRKTGYLITASVTLGAILGGAEEKTIQCLKQYGMATGLAFQITDDILDVRGSTENLGKQIGSDNKKGKATYPGILGMDEAIKKQTVLFRQAIDALQSFDEKANPLRGIAKLIIERDK
jgi:geranylgeranyl diphosphate synthase type II